jgi:hypothetical protein
MTVVLYGCSMLACVALHLVQHVLCMLVMTRLLVAQEPCHGAGAPDGRGGTHAQHLAQYDVSGKSGELQVCCNMQDQLLQHCASLKLHQLHYSS